MQISVTVAGCTKTTGYIRLGPRMPDIILVKQEVEYQLTGDQVIHLRQDSEEPRLHFCKAANFRAHTVTVSDKLPCRSRGGARSSTLKSGTPSSQRHSWCAITLRL